MQLQIGGIGLVAVVLIAAPVLAEGVAQLVPGPTYHDMCDASAAVAIGTHGFIVGNDEDNVLRLFSRENGGDPILEYDLTDFLRPDAEHPEADIEGAAWLGNRIFWITSHARNKDGKMRLSRYRLFATEFTKVDGRTVVRTYGTPYRFFLDDLVNDRRYRKYDLRVAMKYPPKSDFALNVEGLTSTPDGQLWVGLRNPIVDGKALLVPIANPLEVVDGQPANLGDPIELELGGLGIRGIEYHEPWKRYVILGGPKASGEVTLFTWSGQPHEEPARVPGVDFAETTPEAFVCYVSDIGTELQIICDDGTRRIEDKDCKSLENRNDRRFRTWFVRGWSP